MKQVICWLREMRELARQTNQAGTEQPECAGFRHDSCVAAYHATLCTLKAAY